MSCSPAGQTFVSGIDPALIKFGSTRLAGIPVAFFITLIVAAIAWYFHPRPVRAVAVRDQ